MLELDIFGKYHSKEVYNNLCISADNWISKIRLDKGSENLHRYFEKVNPLLNTNVWIDRFTQGSEGYSFHKLLMKLREVNPKYLNNRKDKLILILSYRLRNKSYPEGFYDIYLCPLIENILNNSRLSEIKEGFTFRSDENISKGIEDLGLILGYSKEDLLLRVYRRFFVLEKIKRIKDSKGVFCAEYKVKKIKSVDDQLKSLLRKHSFEFFDKDVNISRCLTHFPKVVQCEDTGKVYDYSRCKIYPNEKLWKSKRSGNLEEEMDCLQSYLDITRRKGVITLDTMQQKQFSSKEFVLKEKVEEISDKSLPDG